MLRVFLKNTQYYWEYPISTKHMNVYFQAYLVTFLDFNLSIKHSPNICLEKLFLEKALSEILFSRMKNQSLYQMPSKEEAIKNASPLLDSSQTLPHFN